jgi:hypothetical protein
MSKKRNIPMAHFQYQREGCGHLILPSRLKGVPSSWGAGKAQRCQVPHRIQHYFSFINISMGEGGMKLKLNCQSIKLYRKVRKVSGCVHLT